MKAEKQNLFPLPRQNYLAGATPKFDFADNRPESHTQALLIKAIHQQKNKNACIQCQIGKGKEVGQFVIDTQTSEIYVITEVTETGYLLRKKLPEISVSPLSSPPPLIVDFNNERYSCQEIDTPTNVSSTPVKLISPPLTEEESDDDIPFFLKGEYATEEKDISESQSSRQPGEKDDFPSEKEWKWSMEEEEGKDEEEEEEEEDTTDYIASRLSFPSNLFIPSLAYAYSKPQINLDLKDLPARFVKEIHTILSAEIEQESHAILYHSASISTYLFTTILGIIYKTLDRSIAEDFVFFRDFTRSPLSSLEPPVSPAKFLREKAFTQADKKRMNTSSIWTDHQAKEELLSTNLSLLGHYGNPGEQSYHYDSTGMAGLLPYSLSDMVGGITIPPSISSKAIEAIIPEIKELIRQLCYNINTITRQRQSQSFFSSPSSPSKTEETRDRVLYQIFIPKRILNQCVYIAQVNGTPLLSPPPTLAHIEPQTVFEGIAEAGRAHNNLVLEDYGTKQQSQRIDDPTSFFTSGEFTHMVFEAARYKEFWQKFSTSWTEPQARILFNSTLNPLKNPDIARPGGMRARTYLFLSPEIKSLIEPALDQIRTLVEKATSPSQ